MDYTRNLLGQIDSVTTAQGANFNTLTSSITYEPFGPMNGMSYGNGVSETRHYDSDYRLIQLQRDAAQGCANAAGAGCAGAALDYTFDPANNITAIVNNNDSTRCPARLTDSRIVLWMSPIF